MLFAALLAQTADGEGAQETPDTANTVPEAATETAKKTDEAGDAAVAALMAPPQMPIQLSVLQANFGAEDDAAPKAETDIAANDETQPPQAKTVENEVKRQLQNKTAATDRPSDESGVDVAIAASAGVSAVVDVQGADTKTSPKKTDISTAPVGAAQKTQSPSGAGENLVAAKGETPAQATDAAKTVATADKAAATAQDATNDDIQDVKATPADKAAALADMADKSVRQTAASNAAQARSLPVQDAAQAPSTPAQNNDGGKSGSSERQATQENSATQAKGDALRADTGAAQPAPAAQSVAHNAVQGTHETAPVQQVTASVSPQAQAQAPVAASVQVAQQQAHVAAQPDLSGLAVQIAAKSDEGTQHFSIRLDPAELGRVDVRLSIDDAGRAQAHLSVEKPQTLDLLQRDRTDLERALKDCGVDLSQSGLNFSLKGQERQGEQPTPFKGRSRTLQASLALDTATAATAASTQYFAGGTSRLDIRV